MAALPLRPAALLVITNPPQSPAPGLHTVTRTEGHETAAASERSTGKEGALGLSFRLVKMALRLVKDPPVAAPNTVNFPPFVVTGPPRVLRTRRQPNTEC